MKSTSYYDWQPGRYNPWYRPGPSKMQAELDREAKRLACDCSACYPVQDFHCLDCDVKWIEKVASASVVQASLCWHCGSWVALVD